MALKYGEILGISVLSVSWMEMVSFYIGNTSFGESFYLIADK
jgi:hypothetical protein